MCASRHSAGARPRVTDPRKNDPRQTDCSKRSEANDLRQTFCFVFCSTPVLLRSGTPLLLHPATLELRCPGTPLSQHSATPVLWCSTAPASCCSCTPLLWHSASPALRRSAAPVPCCADAQALCYSSTLALHCSGAAIMQRNALAFRCSVSGRGDGTRGQSIAAMGWSAGAKGQTAGGKSRNAGTRLRSAGARAGAPEQWRCKGPRQSKRGAGDIHVHVFGDESATAVHQRRLGDVIWAFGNCGALATESNGDMFALVPYSMR